MPGENLAPNLQTFTGVTVPGKNLAPNLQRFPGVTVPGKNLAPNRQTFTSNVFLLQNTMQKLNMNAPRGFDTNYTKTNVLFM